MSAPGLAARLRSPVRAYVGMFRIKLIAGMQYRAAAWAGVATQFFWGFMLLMVYNAFYEGSSADPGMEFSQLAAYVWLQQAFLGLMMLWYADGELTEAITSGAVAYELCRPLSLYSLWFARRLGGRVATTLLRMGPLLLVAFFLPAPYRFILPPDLAATGLFFVSLVLSALLVMAIEMFIYVLTFYLLSPSAPRLLISFTADFFSGHLIPVPLMPQAMQKVVSWLPFRYTFDVTVRIYAGHMVGAEALLGIAAQLMWVVALIALGAWAFSRAMRRTVVQGG